LERSGGIEWLAFRPGQAKPSESDLSTPSVEEHVDGVGMDSVDHPHDPRWIARRSIGGSPAPIGLKAAPSNDFGPP
jgi:hypothetical protein